MTQVQTCTREVLEVTHPNGRVEYLTKENYLGFSEWKHDLIVESTRNNSGEPVLTGKSGAIYRLKKLSFEYPLTSSQLPSDSGHNSKNTEEKQMSHKSSTKVTAQAFTHPNLTHLSGVVFPPLSEHLQEFNKSEAELQAMSYQELDDATDILQDMEFSGLDHRTSPWIKMYATYRNSSQLNGRKSWNESVASLPSSSEVNPPVAPTPVVEEKQMSVKAISSKSPVFLAAQESETLDIIENLLLNVSHDTSLTDDLILGVQAYIASEGLDGNKSHDELGQLARKAKMWGVFKLCGQVKGSDAFQNLIAKYTPELIVSGGNQMGAVVATGTTAKEVASPIKPDWLSQLPVVTDTPEDILKAHGLTKASKPAKGTKAPKAKKEKVAKSKPALTLPTIADISALEALDRKSLQQAIMAVNSQGINSGVNGKSSSEAIKIALAKELLGVEGYLPPVVTSTAKASKGKSAKAPEAPLPMPEAITWEEIKGMSYRQLQGFCKVLRSNGLFEGNVGGKGSGKEILLSKAADAMRQLGHEIIEANLIPVNPDEAKPILERYGVKYDLHCQATALLLAA